MEMIKKQSNLKIDSEEGISSEINDFDTSYNKYENEITPIVKTDFYESDSG